MLNPDPPADQANAEFIGLQVPGEIETSLHGVRRIMRTTLTIPCRLRAIDFLLQFDEDNRLEPIDSIRGMRRKVELENNMSPGVNN